MKMMDGLSLQTVNNRMNYAIRDKIGKRNQEQRRNLMYLVAEFLRQQGLYKSYEALTDEAHLTNNFEICDNVDLEIVFTEYCDYYHARFNKLPQICKRVVNPTSSKDLFEVSNSKDNKKKPKPKVQSDDEENSNDFGLMVKPLFQKNSASVELHSEESNGPFTNEKTLRPLGNLYPAGSEYREIADLITREIVMTNLNVHWSDICGLRYCKQMLKEAVVFPTKYPQLFSKLFTPWKGILLYGPPGTGKTMLAKAVATECDLTFFNITASSLVSKWRGDSEKYIRVLFELANHHAPSIIFIDEIDWIAAGDGASASDKSEPARRFRAELLSRLDGLMSEDNSRVTLLAATNAPWNLDSALLRRLEKHLHVDVPDSSARRAIFEVYTEKNLHNTPLFKELVRLTDGYSSADLKRLCKEAWMVQIRPICDDLEKGTRELKKSDTIAHCTSLQDCSIIRVCLSDMPSTVKHLRGKYEEWQKTLSSPS